MIDIIKRNAKRLEKLSNNLLDVSRIENKSLNLHKEKLDLNQKIKDVVTDSKSFITPGKDVKIVFNPFRDSIIIVEADGIRLFEVISNLIKNAIKFTDKGTITVKAERHDSYAIVSVKDTGSGIEPDIMTRLFTKFATKSEKGIGLGLYISKNIVEAHGGKIWAQNNPDRKGSTFSFTLPIIEESAV
jgi:signal transduction histidine kinase